MNRKTLLFAVISLLIAAMTVIAQVNTSTLTGTVTNLTGSPVANASVSVVNTSTNEAKRVLTGLDGRFTIAGLAPGAYTLVVEIAGFKRTAQQNVVISATANTPINITLEPGSAAETVELNGKTPATQTQTGEIGMGVVMPEIQQLPVIDRNNQQLTELETGITPPTPSLPLTTDPERNRYFATNGQSPAWNMFTVDGAANWEPFRGSEIRVQPDEFMQQKNMVTSNYVENQGFSGGAVVHDLTRAGTDDWHGSLFEFWSGDDLQTRPSFDPRSGTPRFVYNQMGATIGGPVVRDKTFIFGSYEGTFENGDSANLTTVPTAAALTGNFSGIPGLTLYRPGTGVNGFGTQYPGNMIPSASLNRAALSIAAAIPTPNLPGLVDNYYATTPALNHDEKFDGRLDQHFTDRTGANLRFGFSNDDAHEGSVLGSTIGSGTRDRLLAYNSAAELTHEFSPSFIGEGRISYNRYDASLGLWGNPGALNGMPGFTNFTGNLSSINIAGLAPIGAAPYYPENPIDNTFQAATNWNKIASRHNIKFGADVRRIRSDGFDESPFNPAFGSNGTFYFGPGATLNNVPGATLSQNGLLYNSLAAFLTGAPTQYGISNYLMAPMIRQTEYSAWAGDTLTFFGRLTVDIGLRWELYSPLSADNPGGAAFFNANTNTFNYSGINGYNSAASRYDTHDFAPRFGYALRVTDKTTIRGGYGISYFQTPYLYSGFEAPSYGYVTGAYGGYGTAALATPFNGTLIDTAAPRGGFVNGTAAGNLPATLVPRGLRMPYIQSFSTELQQEFYWGTVLQVGYVGTLGREMPYIEELNASMPGTGLAGLPFYSMGRTSSTLLFNNALTDNYNALQVKLGKRFAKGLDFNAAYTWSKALGYTTGAYMLLNPFNIRSNYGPQDFDRQNVLTISHLWEIPWGRNGKSPMATALGGWQVNGIFTWATGTPLTLTADPITCGCFGMSPYVNLTNSANPFQGGGNSVLNPGAFSVASGGAFGNLGRGALRGPGMTEYDLSLFKNFRVYERFNLQLRGEAYNLLNSKRFMNPVTNLSAADFGQMVGSTFGAFGRQINLGLRVTF